MSTYSQVREEIAQVFSDFNTPGVPGSGVKEPLKSEIRSVLRNMTDLSQVAGTTLVYATVAEMNAADDPDIVGSRAEVRDDPDGDVEDGNGVYQWDGTAWVWISNLIPTVVDDRLDAIEAEQVTPLAVTASVSPTEAEVGSTQTVTVSGTVSRTPDSITIDEGVGSQTPGTSYSDTDTGVTASTTYTVTVVSGLLTRTAQASVTFKRKRYYGVTTKAPGVSLTNSEILALTGEFDTDVARSGLVFDCSASGGRYPVICWPAAWGAPSKVLVGGLEFTAYTIEEQSVTNASSSAATYKILRFNTIQNGSSIGVTFNG